MASAPPGWVQAVQAWTGWLAASGTPESTRYLRTYHLLRTGHQLRETHPTPWTVELDDLLVVVADPSWAPNTRRSWRASLRAFYRWAADTGRVPVSPAAGLPQVKVPRGMPRPAPEDVVRDSLDHAEPRVRLMVSLGAWCGLRRGEVCRVRGEDVQRDNQGGWTLRVTGKGGHVRVIPMPPELARAVRLAADPDGSQGGGWVFPSTSARSRTGHLTAGHVGRLVSEALPEGLASHTLRHRCGSVTYEATGDLLAVGGLLGHVRPETTAIYAQLSDARLRAAARAAWA